MKTDNPWALMDALVEKTKEPSGNCWFTVDDYAKRYGLNTATAAGNLRRMVAQGKLEVWKGYCKATHRISNKYKLRK